MHLLSLEGICLGLLSYAMGGGGVGWDDTYEVNVRVLTFPSVHWLLSVVQFPGQDHPRGKVMDAGTNHEIVSVCREFEIFAPILLHFFFAFRLFRLFSRVCQAPPPSG